MALTIKPSSIEGVLILVLSPRITAAESGALREAVTQAAANGQTKIILDLAGVDYIDSTGLGSMVICFTSIKKLGGALKLANLNKRNVELLALTKLHMIFEIFSDVQEAVNSFFPDRAIKRFDILNFVQQQDEEER